MGKTTEKITDMMKEQLIALYNQGKMDSEIANELNVTTGAIYYWRKKLNLKSKFNYSKISKINKKKFEELFYSGYTDSQIAKELGMSSDGIYSHRVRNGYIRENYNVSKPKILSDYQKQVLLGTMLGDSSFKKTHDMINPGITCGHSIKQKEYCEYKTSIFENLGAKCKHSKRNTPDKRTGKYYEIYTMRVPANSELKGWYNSFYQNGKKRIPFELFEYFTEVSLAFMFMDDGSKTDCGYTIATNCFTEEEIIKFRTFLMSKFNLETTMYKSHVLYIRAKSVQKFTDLIFPHIIPSMQYKLHSPCKTS